jgi:hypothetical protein
MTSDIVMIHVRFAPDAQVTEIGERPAALPPQAWFDLLTEKAGTHFQALSGGRGLFRLPAATLASIKSVTTLN